MLTDEQKLARREYNKRWYYANIERAREQARASYKRRHAAGKINKKQQREAALRWIKNNPDKKRESSRRYWLTHPEVRGQWHARNKELKKQWQRQYRHSEPERFVSYAQTRRARLKNVSINDFTIDQWKLVKESYGFKCAYCKCTGKLTMDHVIPIASGGNHTMDNIVPACRSCNSKKGHRKAPVFQIAFVVGN